MFSAAASGELEMVGFVTNGVPRLVVIKKFNVKMFLF